MRIDEKRYKQRRGENNESEEFAIRIHHYLSPTFTKFRIDFLEPEDDVGDYHDGDDVSEVEQHRVSAHLHELFLKTK